MREMSAPYCISNQEEASDSLLLQVMSESAGIAHKALP